MVALLVEAEHVAHARAAAALHADAQAELLGNLLVGDDAAHLGGGALGELDGGRTSGSRIGVQGGLCGSGGGVGHGVGGNGESVSGTRGAVPSCVCARFGFGEAEEDAERREKRTERGRAKSKGDTRAACRLFLRRPARLAYRRPITTTSRKRSEVPPSTSTASRSTM